MREAAVGAVKNLSLGETEVIHCGDCKHWCPGYIVDTAELEYFVTPKCGKYEQMVGHSSDDYCSLAEKKEEK